MRQQFPSISQVEEAPTHLIIFWYNNLPTPEDDLEVAVVRLVSQRMWRESLSTRERREPFPGCGCLALSLLGLALIVLLWRQ